MYAPLQEVNVFETWSDIKSGHNSRLRLEPWLANRLTPSTKLNSCRIVENGDLFVDCFSMCK
jgi:hypothetical protein